MRIPNRVRNAVRALALTRAAADDQRHAATLLRFATSLEEHGLVGPLSTDVEQWAPFIRFAAPGHFYSPLPRLDELTPDAPRIFDLTRVVPGIDLRIPEQRQLVAEIAALPGGDTLATDPTPGRRYHADNFAFGIGDATMLEGMLRLHRPSQLVEIGSGFSSALILDVVDQHLPDTSVTFVEPYTDLLRSLMRDGDDARCRIIEQRAQDLPLEVVRELGEDDILFIDSTHVVRTGSDVCHLVLEVLPSVAPGVIVHVHDIFYPFELPRAWVEEGRQWGECYLLRAFLTENPNWQILLFNDYLGRFERPFLERTIPQVVANPGGSIWLRKVA